MPALPVLCFLVAVGMGGAVGVRLLIVATRTRQLPETALGFSALFLALAAMVSVGPLVAPGLVARGFAIAGNHVLYTLAAAATAAATPRIFRAQSMLARRLSDLAIGLLAISAVVVAASPLDVVTFNLPTSSPAVHAYLVNLSVRTCVYTWIAVECALYYVNQRRSLRFGLTDPLTAQQFLGWSISTSCMALGVVGTLFLRLSTGHSPMATQGGTYFFTALGAVAAVALWLAFFPPRWYVSRLAGEAR